MPQPSAFCTHGNQGRSVMAQTNVQVFGIVGLDLCTCLPRARRTCARPWFSRQALFPVPRLAADGIYQGGVSGEENASTEHLLLLEIWCLCFCHDSWLLLCLQSMLVSVDLLDWRPLHPHDRFPPGNAEVLHHALPEPGADVCLQWLLAASCLFLNLKHMCACVHAGYNFTSLQIGIQM